MILWVSTSRFFWINYIYMYCGEFRKHRYMNIICIKKNTSNSICQHLPHSILLFWVLFSLVFTSLHAYIINLLCKKQFHSAYKALHTQFIYNVSMLGMYVIFIAIQHLLHIMTIVEAIPTSWFLPLQAKVEVSSIFQPRSWLRCSQLHQQPVPTVSGFSDGKESACDVRDQDSIPGAGRSPGEEHGYPLQYSCWRIPWTQDPGWP